MPSTLEYFSYVFHFQALMAGPVIFYRDYMDFIHGHNLTGGKVLTVRFFFNHSYSLSIIININEKAMIFIYLFILSFSLQGYDKKSAHYNEIVLEPSPTTVVIKKVVVSLLCAVMFVTFIPTYPIQKLKGSIYCISHYNSTVRILYYI